jgi:hypothetical protein
MKGVQFIGRFGGLAVGLATGAWLASVPWVATADNGSSGLDIAALDAVSALPSLPGAEADPSGLDIDISYNGSDVFHMGDGATAHSGTGDLAIAYGDGSTADAGYGSTPSGLSLVAQHDTAFADGAGSTAIAGGGDYDSATASNGGTADSGFFDTNGVSSTGGTYDSASADGAGSTADAAGQSFNTATASGGSTADSGFMVFPGHVSQGGIDDSASASGTGSLADAGFGSNDTASVLGDGSTALAGGTAGSDLTYSNDYAAVFGNDLLANATGANNLFVIEPTSFGDAAAALTPADDFGLSSLLADLSGLGL